MIHRTYICRLRPFIDGFPNLDIMMNVPGSRAAPVLNPTHYPAGTPYTAASAAWAAKNGANWYYEVRGRALRIEKLAGTAGFTPRTNLGHHLSIIALQDLAATGDNGNLLPNVTLSESLAPAPAISANLVPDVPGSTYALPLPDPAYGPVIRIWNTPKLSPEQDKNWMLYQVDLQIAENKDDDFTTLGRA